VKVIRMICRPEGAFQARAFFGLPLQGKCFWDDQTQGAALGYDEVALSARANARLGEDREHGLECWQAVGMFPCVSLRCLIAKIRDFQGC